jgi:hypothetical protein
MFPIFVGVIIKAKKMESNSSKLTKGDDPKKKKNENDNEELSKLIKKTRVQKKVLQKMIDQIKHKNKK